MTQESNNRVGFPKARVFIYGHEVSADVVSVNVNQSSGSLERSPTTATINLSNLQSRYIYTIKDIQRVGIIKQSISGTWDEINTEANQDFITYERTYEGESGSVTFAQNDKIANRYDADFTVKGEDVANPLGPLTNVSTDTLNELAESLKGASADEIYYRLQALSTRSDEPIILSREDATALANQILERKRESEKTSSTAMSLVTQESLEIPYGIKQEVTSEKLTKSIHVTADNSRVFSLVGSGKKLLYEYPMSVGDSIFHPNDPVRILLRDPFDPSLWYWSFTGFLDSFTESVGLNGDSQLSLTCTDVTKMGRYSTIMTSTGLISSEDVDTSTLSGATSVSNLGIQLDANLFSYLSIPDILETLFFGSDSAIETSKSSALGLSEQLSQLTTEELDSYLTANFETTLEDIYAGISKGTSSSPVSDKSEGQIPGKGEYPALQNTLSDWLQAKTRTKLDNNKIAPIASPRNVSAKRGSDSAGLRFFEFGDSNIASSPYQSTRLSDLNEWNEELHHRVRFSDYQSMRASETEENIFQSLSDMIYTICTDLENYPVGGGYIYYMAPANLNEIVGTAAFDGGFGNVGSVHSSFKDHLSYLYDMADNIDWRFYATPKGDIVFEMPFYDFDPQDFWAVQKIDQSDRSLVESAYLIESSDPLSFDIQDATFSYARHFSILKNDQLTFSNTQSDQGALTAFRSYPQTIKGEAALTNRDLERFQTATDEALMPTLGFRLSEMESWNFMTTKEEAKIFATLQLAKTNSNTRNAGVDILPKFGLMVNRPMHWEERAYYASLVSCSHSYTWKSNVSTSLNLNNMRGWSGEKNADGSLRYYYFGGLDHPFNYSSLLKTNKDSKTRGGS